MDKRNLSIIVIYVVAVLICISFWSLEIYTQVTLFRNNTKLNVEKPLIFTKNILDAMIADQPTHSASTFNMDAVTETVKLAESTEDYKT